MAEVYFAPQPTPCKSVFLAGSIDMGAAVNWQEAVTKALADKPVVIYNPRRDDWDSSWVQSINDPQFNEQVTWELEHLEKADIICYYFDPAGKAPITLMELGLFAMSGKDIVVCCPEGFWRRGNIEMVCDRYALPLFNYIGDMIDYIKEAIL
jgi:hypothetical protein